MLITFLGLVTFFELLIFFSFIPLIQKLLFTVFIFGLFGDETFVLLFDFLDFEVDL
jgi:hypothetical protein